MRHDGYGPDFNHGVNEPTFTPGVGGPLNQNLNFMYLGGSVFGQIPLTEAIFQPLVARQVLDARRHSIQTAKNDALLMTARAYFRVHEFRGRYTGAIDVVRRGKMLTAGSPRSAKILSRESKLTGQNRFWPTSNSTPPWRGRNGVLPAPI